MDTKGKRRSSTRGWWLLAAAVVAFLVLFDLLDRLTGSEAPVDTATDASAASVPTPPEVVRLEGGGVEIRHDLFRRTTIRLGDDEKERELHDCLVRGLDEAFTGASAEWGRWRVEREVQQVQQACLQGTGAPTVPPLPPLQPRR